MSEEVFQVLRRSRTSANNLKDLIRCRFPLLLLLLFWSSRPNCCSKAENPVSDVPVLFERSAGKVQCTVLLEAALMMGLRQLLPHLLASLLVSTWLTDDLPSLTRPGIVCGPYGVGGP